MAGEQSLISEEVTARDIEFLRKEFDDHERKQNSSLDKIWNKLDEMNKTLLGRPSPTYVYALSFMTFIIGSLSTLVLILLKALVTK